MLEKCLDARDEYPRAATAPGTQRGDASRGLVGHELAALVRECGPWLQDCHPLRIAEPGLELLGDPVADLGVTRNPAQPLAGMTGISQGKRRCQERLRGMGNRRQSGMTTVRSPLRSRDGEARMKVGKGARPDQERRQRRQVRNPTSAAHWARPGIAGGAWSTAGGELGGGALEINGHPGVLDLTIGLCQVEVHAVHGDGRGPLEGPSCRL